MTPYNPAQDLSGFTVANLGFNKRELDFVSTLAPSLGADEEEFLKLSWHQSESWEEDHDIHYETVRDRLRMACIQHAAMYFNELLPNADGGVPKSWARFAKHF